MSVQTLIQLRRGAASLWTSVDPTLNAGEVGYETDTGKYKIGDGITAWTSLKYAAIIPDAFIANSGIGVTQGVNGNSLTISVTGITSSQMTDFISAVDARVTAGSVSASQVMDIVGTGIIAGTGISVSYDTNAFDGQLTISTTGLAYSNHNHTLSNITDVTASATELNYLDGTTLGTVTTGNVVAVDSNADISGFRDVNITRNLIVGGNLTVNGSSTIVNSTTVDIGDNIVQVNVSGAATQGGIQVLDHDNTLTTKLVWDINDSRWEFEGGSANVYTTGTITGKTFTSTETVSPPFSVASTGFVTNLNVDKLDNQDGSYYLDWNNTTNKPDPVISGVLTGDVTGTSSVTLTDLANGTLTINTTLGQNVVGSGNIINGSIINEDINANANISVTKLSAGSAGQVLQVNSSGTIVWNSIDGGTP
jgi:hypothetical protein